MSTNHPLLPTASAPSSPATIALPLPQPFLWVKYEDDEPVPIPTAGCRNVGGLIEAAKEELPLTVGKYDISQLRLYSSVSEKVPLKPGCPITSLPQTTDDAPLILKHQASQITRNEFLRLTLPPVVYDSRPAIKPTTSRANPRIPKKVQLWADFGLNASRFVFADDARVSRPSFTDYKPHIMAKRGVDAAVKTNISNVLSEFLKETGSDLLFTEGQIPEFKGQPDHIIYKKISVNGATRNIPYCFIEDKTVWDLPTPSAEESLVQWWESDVLYETEMGPKRNGKSIFHEITQAYGYMSVNCLRYGVLTTYEQTWFLCRPDIGTLLISEPFRCNAQSPTLIRCFCYLFSLLESNHITEHSPDLTPASSRKHESVPPSFHQYHYQTRSRLLNTIPDGFDISFLTQHIGGGKCGYVYRWNYEGSDIAVKICDATNHDGYVMMQNELKAYNILKPLQGTCIPTILFSGKADNFIVIGMSLIEGHHVEPRSVWPQLSEILQMLSVYGVVHCDVKENNVLLDNSGKVWLIDFGLCEFK